MGIDELLKEGFEILDSEEQMRKELDMISMESLIDVGISEIFSQHPAFHKMLHTPQNQSVAELIFIRWNKRVFGEESVKTYHAWHTGPPKENVGERIDFLEASLEEFITVIGNDMKEIDERIARLEGVKNEED